ncbi:MAG: arylsulfatase [Tannerella sp.]|jgi:arylsulfatase A-like enzyme|nr:arylsulfatase [Tannerella sp.]
MNAPKIIAECFLSSVSGMIFAQTERPNIVIIQADDQGWGDLSFNGNLSVATPNIDRIAKEGVSFENFYVCPVSSPTRAELLTGRYAARGGVRDVSRGGERLNLDEVTVAGYFKSAGYATAAFGKWHNGTQYPYHPNAKGFDEFYGFCSGHWGNYWNPMLEHNGEIVYGEGFIIDDLTNKAIEYIKTNKDKPFFVYIPFNTPHSPMQIPDKWWNRIKNRPLLQQATLADREDTTFTRAALALTENIDWNVGRIVAALERLRVEDNTILIYLSDNGPNSDRWNGGLKGRKGSTDEGGVRSPLFIKWKNHIKSGIIVEQLSGAIDLMPTLLDMADIHPAYMNEIDGKSLKQIIFQQSAVFDRYLFSHWNNKVSVRFRNHLLDADSRLFDMKIDRAQKNDLARQEPQIAEQLKQKVIWYKSAVLSNTAQKDDRPFTIGHLREKFSKLPARDGIPHGNIQRSSAAPNSSYFMNWKQITDSISWNVKVEQAGVFEALIYYTCTRENIGSTLQLSVGDATLQSVLTQANDVPMTGAELDRVPRKESYSKGFAPFSLGNIRISEGEKSISLKAGFIPNEEVMCLQMLVLRRIY